MYVDNYTIYCVVSDKHSRLSQTRSALFFCKLFWKNRALSDSTVITVTFKNSKTSKTTAKKYRCAVKAAAGETPDTPDDPTQETPVEATKITDAKVTTSKTFELTFDGAVDPTTATAIKVMRGTIEAPVTAAYATDNKSVVLTSDTPFAAGTYTVTVGSLEPVTLTVTRQVPAALTILNTTVANKKNATVSFNVLDQYGEPMDNYTGKKLSIQAYNTTKGHAITVDNDTTKAYFMLDCATQDVTSGSTESSYYINSIGDTVNVVAYLTDNAGISTTATLEIANIYMEELEFGEIELGGDKRVTVGKTYMLPYTAKTNEGEKATFGETSVSDLGTISRVFGDYTFVTSNGSSVDMGNFYVDKDGQMFFTATSTPGTAVITMINNMTGTTTSLTIVVNDISKMSSLDVADTSIAWDTNKGNETPAEIKAAVTVYDQFGDVVDPKNVRNTKLSDFNSFFSNPVTAVPGTSGITASKISEDGAYLVYAVDSNITARKTLKGQTVTFTYVSKAAGTSGYITSSSKVIISDTIEPAALTIVTEPAASVVSGESVTVKFSVYDQNQNKVALTAVSGSAWKYTTEQINDKVNSLDYYVVIDDNSNLFNGQITCGDPDIDKKEYSFKLTSAMGSNLSATDLSRSGQFTISLKQDTGRVTSKSFNLNIIRPVTDYFVSTDASTYSAGDKVTVSVDAYSQYGEEMNVGYLFNSLFNKTVTASVTVGTGTYSKTLVFENGTATFEVTAGKEGEYSIAVTDMNSEDSVSNTRLQSTLPKFKVVASNAGKLIANTDGKLQITDSQGNPTKAGARTAYATIKLMDETLNKDITGDVTMPDISVKSDNTAVVTIDSNNIVTSIGGYDTYNLAVSGVAITGIPETSTNNNSLVLSITIDGMTWEQRFVCDSASEEVVDLAAYTAKINKDTAEANANGDFTAAETYMRTVSGASIVINIADIKASVPSNSAIAITGGSVNVTSCSAITGAAVTISGIVSIANGKATVNFVQGATSSAIVSGGGLTLEGSMATGDKIVVTYYVSVTNTVGGQDFTKTDAISVKYTWNAATGKWESGTP